MKSLKESLFDRDLVTKDIIYHPKTRDELVDCIKEQLELQGSDANLNIIDVSEITNMSFLFSCFYDKIKNIDISKWNVSKVKDMSYMFCDCKQFNSDLSKWNVSKVENMSFMFYKCKNFNSDLSKWDVKNVIYMSDMFYECISFNSDLSKWNVSKVEDMGHMFFDCKKFNSNLSKWDVSKVKFMDYVLFGCKSLKKIPSWYEKS